MAAMSLAERCAADVMDGTLTGRQALEIVEAFGEVDEYYEALETLKDDQYANY